MADTFKGIITADGKKRQLPYGSILELPVSDTTLSMQGGFADSRVVGDKFEEVKTETSSLKEDFTTHLSSCLTESQVRTIVTSYGYTSVTDSYINSLIDAKLGVIENGTY